MPGRLPNHGFGEVSFRTTGSGKVPGQVPGLLGIIPRLILFYRCKGGKKNKKNILFVAGRIVTGNSFPGRPKICSY